MRESNFHFPSANKACVSITSALYDRRALDCTADLPLVNSLSHLNFLTSSSARIREILTTDGGLERLVRILRTTRVTDDTLHNWKWTMAFQCVVNVGVRGTAEIRQRVVQVGAVPILVEILHAYLLGTEVHRLELKVRDALNAQAERLPISKMLGFAADPGMQNSDEHAEINDPSNSVVSSHILASGANNSTGAAQPRSSSAAAAARSSAHAAAAAAVAAVSGVNPIPVAVPSMLPAVAGLGATGARQQTRRVGEGVHPLARHVAYSDSTIGPAAAAAAAATTASGPYMPYSSQAYMYGELERLQEELDVARRRLQAINHVMYRHDDVVLTLQLLAYLSKTPSQRQQLHECPLLYTQMRATNGSTLQPNATNSSNGNFGPVGSGYATQADLDIPHQAAQAAARANAAAGIPVPLRRQSAGDSTVDVFSIVERFTVHKSFPSDMAYWSAIVMRNGCRRDETRNYYRQCAYSRCQKWELQPNEFSKCRRCRKAKYCSKNCQSLAWQEGHRNWCNERNPSSTGNPGSMDGDAAVVAAAAAAATVTGSVVALAGTMPTQQHQPTPPQPHLPHNQQQHQQHQQSLYVQPTLGNAMPTASPVPTLASDFGATIAHRPAAGGPVPSAAHGSHHHHQHHSHHHHHHHPYRSAESQSPAPAPSGRSRSRGRGGANI
ncbi:hypothetical protein IWW38_002358 [Coemansia aciculifera]|uniref:Uncharacterized protein n=1 Tax=Coemansia aciculifera TaxID=417176 RepID=A0ACC1M5F7_9FUNG|nr:hypothetical protein IWW38_002358 [Coemansia aciculifera]